MQPLNRKQRRLQERSRQKNAELLYRQPAEPLLEIDMESVTYRPSWMTRAYRNNRYTVMIQDNAHTTKGSAICVRVQSHFDKPIPNHWLEMQRIKNELFGKETTAVEYYPAESALEDYHNIYWMWIFPEGVLPMPIL